MNVSHSLWFAALALMGGSVLGAAEETMKPGLWEITTKVNSNSGEMEKTMAEIQKQMASMPPEQRKAMEDLLGKQGEGVTGGPVNTATKVCITKEMAQANDIPKAPGNCTQTSAPRTGNTTKFSFVCTHPPSSGEGQVTLSGPDSYSATATVTSNSTGKPETINMDSAGKFLGSDCDNIKPLVPPKK